jgi:hypothetical protein
MVFHYGSSEHDRILFGSKVVYLVGAVYSFFIGLWSTVDCRLEKKVAYYLVVVDLRAAAAAAAVMDCGVLLLYGGCAVLILHCC